jgi:hypothetical protein
VNLGRSRDLGELLDELFSALSQTFVQEHCDPGVDLTINYNIIQIVPRRTVQPDGIGDYSTLLAQALLERTGGNSRFVVGTPSRIEPPRQDRWKTHPVVHRTGSALADQLSALCQTENIAAVVLHVSGYGYQNRGVPIWLLEGMRIWHKTRASCRLYGIFHELFASGQPWNSSFWLSGAQRYVTRGLWDLCDAGSATTSQSFDQLAAWRPEMVPLLRTTPVFSNVGEPDRVTPSGERPPNMAVFGQRGVESRIYAGDEYEQSASIAKALGITKIIDIGARTSPVPDHLGAVPIIAMGQLAPRCVSRHLMSCQFGLINYADIAFLEKSGVFAAYAAHGVIPVCIGSLDDPPTGLEEGRHLLRWPMKVTPNLDAMQSSLAQWYSGHSTGKHADLLASWCVAHERSRQQQTADLNVATWRRD